MDEIVVEHYDPTWPARFATERAFIGTCFKIPPLAIEHIGSTSVPGLPAKPIIDILVLVDNLEAAQDAIPALEAGGYSYWRANPDKTRLFLVKGLPPSAPARTHHLHILADSAEARRHLLFRNALRHDAALRDDYARLKQDLASRLRQDRDAYSDAKTAFIDHAVELIGGPPRKRPRP